MSEIQANKLSPASGTNLVLGDSSDTIQVPSGVTLDVASGGTLDVTGATVSGLSSGLSNADYWKYHTDKSISANTTTLITGSWGSQVDYGGAGGELGNAMSESSGIWTFPQTGIYYVHAWFRWVLGGDSRFINTTLEVTLNNSSYTSMSMGSGFVQQTESDNTTTQTNVFGLIDVTDTAQVKFRLQVHSRQAITLNGDASSFSGLISMRLGDT
mgnify:FL=1